MRHISQISRMAMFIAMASCGWSCARGSTQTSSEEKSWQEDGDTAPQAGTSTAQTNQPNDHRIAPWRANPKMSLEERREAIAQRHIERLSKHPYGRLRGEVRDANGRPLAGIRVSASPMGAPVDAPREMSVPMVTAYTNQEGQYVLDEAFVGPEVLSFEHPEYVFKQEIDIVGQGETHAVDVHLLHRRQPHHFNADEGKQIEEGAVRIQLPPGILVFKDDGMPVHGDVDVTVTPVDPRIEGEIDAAPARLEGITTRGTGTTLMSYGMVEVEMAQGSRALQIRSGERVNVDFSVKGMPNVADGDIIPMWHHERSTGYWHQDRNADAQVRTTRDGALVASTRLPHFSSWNVDMPSDSICTQFMLRRVQGTPSINANSVMIRSTNPGYTWSIKPYGLTIDRGRDPDSLGQACTFNPSSPECICNTNPALPECDQARVLTFNAPKGYYGNNQQYRIEAKTGPNTTIPLLVRSPSGQASGQLYTEGTTVSAGQVDQYIRNNANNADVGNWCGPLPSQWSWARAQHFDDLVMAGSDIRPGNYTSGTVFGVPLSRYKMHFTYALRPQGTIFAEGAAQAAQNLALLYPVDNDADQDGIKDEVDNCPFRPNPSQNNSDGNDRGDACESYCYVSPNISDAAWYDTDGDGIDDWCDNNPWVANDTQLVNIAYDM